MKIREIRGNEVLGVQPPPAHTKRFLTLIPAACLLLLAAIATAQTAFTADLVNLKQPGNPYQTKIYFSKNRLRIEGHNKNGQTASIMIVDLAVRHSVVLMPQQKMYLEQAQPQIPNQGVIFFVAQNPEDACPDWTLIANDDLAGCEKAGKETVNGRDAVKYVGKYEEKSEEEAGGTERPSAPEDKTITLWVDSKFHFPLKWQNQQVDKELRNILEAPQPDSLFRIPVGYTKRHFTSSQNKSTPK